MNKLWERAVEIAFAFWLAFMLFGIGAVAILGWMGVPLSPNIFIVAAGWVEAQFMKLRNSCPSCRQEWRFAQGIFICDHCGLRTERRPSN
jgi:hypothetical protein